MSHHGTCLYPDHQADPWWNALPCRRACRQVQKTLQITMLYTWRSPAAILHTRTRACEGSSHAAAGVRGPTCVLMFLRPVLGVSDSSKLDLRVPRGLAAPGARGGKPSDTDLSRSLIVLGMPPRMELSREGGLLSCSATAAAAASSMRMATLMLWSTSLKDGEWPAHHACV